MECAECKKEITGKLIEQKPNRSAISPASSKYLECFCSKECQDKLNLKRYIWFAILDRNACDSECFEHTGWRKDRLHRNIRIGKCKITGKIVEVQPLYHGDTSGQPIECYEHFELRKDYLSKLKELGYKIVPDKTNHCLIVNI